jgi:hypothetical protein
MRRLRRLIWDEFVWDLDRVVVVKLYGKVDTCMWWIGIGSDLRLSGHLRRGLPAGSIDVSELVKLGIE